jgi:hypothetical protein
VQGRIARYALASLCVFGGCAVSSACDSGDSGQGGQDNGTVLPTGGGSQLDTPKRGCDSAVFGTLASDWRQHATIAGPLAWLGISGYAADPPATFAVQDGRYLFKKALAVVERGALVKIVVPESERPRLSLFYSASGTRPDNLYAIAEGKASWALRACEDTETQFNGGFIVGGAQCAALDVFVKGKSQPIRVFIPFGTGKRPCP